MTNQALVPVQAHTLTPDVWEMMKEIAPVMYDSRLFAMASPAQALSILLKGRELGFGPAASFEFIHVIQGKPGLSPKGALAILHGNPEIAKIEISALHDSTGAYIGHQCTIKRRNGFEYTAQFTLADAQRAGLVKADGGWEHYPQNMCLWRAVGFAADVAAPDLTAGATLLMKAPEQFGVGLTEDGDVIEGQVTQQPYPTLLDRMVGDLGPEAILNANGGELPATDEDVARVAKELMYEIPF